MIDALIGGTLFKKPRQHTAKNGGVFATATIRAATGDGGSLFVNCIAFEERAVSALLALDAGDSVTVTFISGLPAPRAGSKPRAGINHFSLGCAGFAAYLVEYQLLTGNPQPSLDVVAQQVLTAYHVQRKRRAASSQGDKTPIGSRESWPELDAQPAGEQECDQIDPQKSWPEWDAQH